MTVGLFQKHFRMCTRIVHLISSHMARAQRKRWPFFGGFSFCGLLECQIRKLELLVDLL